jgi:hypothetical protein
MIVTQRGCNHQQHALLGGGIARPSAKTDSARSSALFVRQPIDLNAGSDA